MPVRSQSWHTRRLAGECVPRDEEEFFTLPLEEKMAVHNSKSPCQMGYHYILEGRADDVTRGGKIFSVLLPIPEVHRLSKILGRPLKWFLILLIEKHSWLVLRALQAA